MFCPNCGSKNGFEQSYCRGCGLKLDAVVEAVADQFPSKEFVELQRRKERFEKLGMFSLAVAAFVGFALLMFKAIEYKLILFGPEILIGSAIVALIGFLLLSVFFFNYPKFFLRSKRLAPVGSPHVSKGLSPMDGADADIATAKLIEDRPADYVASVTENTTKSLHTPREDRRS